MDRDEQEQIIARLREAVRRTQAKYDQARKEFVIELGSGAQSPDSGFAVTQASRRESQARHDFRKAVVAFTRFILDGKLPAERN